MPASHCTAWRINKARADAFAARFHDDPAWGIVITFYAGLHLTQAYLLAKGARFAADSHRERREAIRSAPELRGRFFAVYEQLKQLSESVRYDPGFVVSPTHCADARMCLAAVESFLITKIERKLGKGFTTGGP